MTLPDDMRQDEVSRGMRKARADARAALGLDFKQAKAAPVSDLPPGFVPVDDLPPGFVVDEIRRKTGAR